MPPSKQLVDFNKQIVGGEVGALIGTPLAPWIAAHFTSDPNRISFSAVLGGMLTGSVVWLVMKYRHEAVPGANALAVIAEKIAFFTPAAFGLGLIVYQPTLFLVARHAMKRGHSAFISAVFGQAAAFLLFLSAINLYRVALQRVAGRQL